MTVRAATLRQQGHGRVVCEGERESEGLLCFSYIGRRLDKSHKSCLGDTGIPKRSYWKPQETVKVRVCERDERTEQLSHYATDAIHHMIP